MSLTKGSCTTSQIEKRFIPFFFFKMNRKLSKMVSALKLTFTQNQLKLCTFEYCCQQIAYIWAFSNLSNTAREFLFLNRVPSWKEELTQPNCASFSTKTPLFYSNYQQLFQLRNLGLIFPDTFRCILFQVHLFFGGCYRSYYCVCIHKRKQNSTQFCATHFCIRHLFSGYVYH